MNLNKKVLMKYIHKKKTEKARAKMLADQANARRQKVKQGGENYHTKKQEVLENCQKEEEATEAKK